MLSKLSLNQNHKQERIKTVMVLKTMDTCLCQSKDSKEKNQNLKLMITKMVVVKVPLIMDICLSRNKDLKRRRNQNLS